MSIVRSSIIDKQVETVKIISAGSTNDILVKATERSPLSIQTPELINQPKIRQRSLTPRENSK